MSNPAPPSEAAPPGRRRSSRRRLAALLTAAILLLLAHGALWLLVTSQLLAALPALQAGAAADGWTLQTAPATRSGWPGAATVSLPAATLTRDFGGTSLQLSLQTLQLGIWPFSPTHAKLLVAGPGQLRLGAGPPIPLSADEAVLDVPLRVPGPATLLIRDLLAGTAASGVSVARISASLAPGAVDLSAGPLLLAPPLPAPFGAGAGVSARLRLVPPPPRADTPAASAARWRAEGGRLAVSDLLLASGPLRVEGSLGGGLDPSLQPEGEAALKVSGGLDLLEAASRAGLVQPGPASAIRAVLGLLTLASRGGPVSLPLALRNHTLAAAGIPLLRVPPLDWNAR